MPRFHCATALAPEAVLELPAGAARHVQVLRLQPGDSITLFDGLSDAEFDATITRMGRGDVQVQVGAGRSNPREPACAVHLAVGMPANERMDWLVEKATELGVASIQPLMTERSVLKLSGERADKKVAHWQSVAIAACEQCGGNRVPTIHPLRTLAQWLKGSAMPPPGGRRLLLSLREGSLPVRQAAGSERAEPAAVWFLSGPEGGLSPGEENAAIAAGFCAASLGPRVLRAETAALTALALLTQSAATLPT
ncbi:16S rRNA (uracil(1498)-N(3))-methyltransferase [Rhodoferax sp. OV413]|uniref:16S rRNA (uracil(1498)-N(3))-methyltransferase n=1 Tax=Rhodoferax sp. OV413 TaxID=1855285 RepID=UPI0025E2D243|nr:16S rRNA (uracil(1498)-N(3))-methyltransferase [Rhodoferax sp. OV413]